MRNFLYIILLTVISISQGHSQLFETLPGAVQQSVMWYADMEEGNLQDWSELNATNPGGEIEVKGGDDNSVSVDSRFAHTGKYSIKTSLKNALSASAKEIRLVRWADNSKDNGGKDLPGTGYYSTFAYLPYVYNPHFSNSQESDWTIFEFKNSNSATAPIWKVVVEYDRSTNKMALALKSSTGATKKYIQKPQSKINLPVNKWTHIEVFYKASNTNLADGQISLWQDGESLFEINDVVTSISDNSVEWSLTNSAEYITGEAVDGRASIYYDDSMISGVAIHPYLDVVAALPLELVSFNVINAGKEVEIKWRAASESNIKHYVVQRRFETEDVYTDIDVLAAINDESVTSQYRILDLENKKAGVYYYRLHVKDNDGQEYFSDLQSANIRSRNISGLMAFPNPVQNKLNLEGLGAEEELTLIRVYDLSGNRHIELNDYTNQSTLIDLSELNPGMYIIQISKGLDRFSKKIIKH